MGRFPARRGDCVRMLCLGVFCLSAGVGILASAISGCAVAKSEGGVGTITKGPVLLRVYQNRAALMWETNVEGPGRIEYGTGGSLDREATTRPSRVTYGKKRQAAFIHKVWLEGLQAGQAYGYRVCGPGIRGDVHEFRTVPAESDRVRFAVYGDSRSRPKSHRRLIELMIEKDVDFVVHTGDLVSSGSKYEQWGPQFFEPIKGLAESAPFYIAKGNHEGSSGNYEKLLVPKGEEKGFSFDYGPVHHCGIDNSSRRSNVAGKLKAIVDDAKASKAEWKFVSYHVPSLNFGGHWSAWGYPDALPAFSKAGIDFVTTGHSHQYERFKPVAPVAAGDGGYVTYMTCGGGGAPLYSVKPTVHHAHAAATHHFCLFEVKGEKLTMETIDIEGKVVDRLEITKSGGRLDEAYRQTSTPMVAVMLYQEKNLDKQD
jgi:predicted phosphodiesterase